MTDSGRPEPVAWWCYACENSFNYQHDCGTYKEIAPLYPASVVAGEWREFEEFYRTLVRERFVTPATKIFSEIAGEAARRAEKWEAK